MLPKILTWLCAGLFIVFGIVTALSDDAAQRALFMGLTILALGGFTVFMVLDAAATGELRLRHAVVRRADRPVLFRAAVLLFAVTGLAVVGFGLWLMFFKL